MSQLALTGQKRGYHGVYIKPADKVITAFSSMIWVLSKTAAAIGILLLLRLVQSLWTWSIYIFVQSGRWALNQGSVLGKCVIRQLANLNMKQRRYYQCSKLKVQAGV